MKIGITTDTLDSAKYFKGVANYTKSLIETIAELKSNHKFYTIHYHQNNNKIYQLGLNEIILSPYFNSFNSISKLMANTFKGKKVLKNFDIIHFTEPRVSDIPLYYLNNTKKVLTVHGIDLYIPQKYKATLREQPIGWLYQKLLAITLPIIKEKISMYITASQFMKDELVNNLKISEEKISVIPFAPNEIFKPINFQYDKPINFILSDVAHPNLIKVFYNLKKRGIKHKLLIFGWRGSGYSNAREIATTLNIQNDIIFTEHLPQEELVKLYNTADVFIHIADYEGFGFPPLEAMACGCPVVSTNVGALPEIIGDAGILKNPKDVKGIEKAVYDVLTNENMRKEMSKKSIKQAEKFSWKKTAEETVKVYNEVVR